MFFVTRWELWNVIGATCDLATKKDIYEERFMGLNLRVVDYELPEDVRMVYAMPEWLRRSPT